VSTGHRGKAPSAVTAVWPGRRGFALWRGYHQPNAAGTAGAADRDYYGRHRGDFCDSAADPCIEHLKQNEASSARNIRMLTACH